MRERLQSAQSTGLRFVTVLARTSLPEILLISTYIISHFLPNADFSYPYELVLPTLLLAVLITIIFYAYRLIFRRVLTAHIASLPLAYYLYHYGDLAQWGRAVFGPILPDRFETPFTMAALTLLGAFVIFGALAYAIVRLARLRPSLGIDLTLTKIVLFIVTFNFLVQAVVVGNYFYRTRQQVAYQHQEPAPKQKPGAPVTKPDIYYLLFDRYAGSETLSDVYGYDNSAFMSYLDSQDFVTRQNAYANYPYTMASVGSTLAMDYLPELAQFKDDPKHTGFPYRSVLNKPPVVDALKQNGYEYNLLSSWWDFARIGVQADREPTKSFRLQLLGRDFYQSDFSRDIINRTALSPLLKKGIGVGSAKLVHYDLDRNPTENFRSQMAALEQQIKADYDKPQFTFAHILLPHDPYIFNADGSQTTYSRDRNDEGADEYVKYVNQVKYANAQIEKLIDSIKQQNPDAVIVLQADEGPYPKQFRGALTASHYYDPKNLPQQEMRQKMSILASYYLPGVDKAEVAAGIDSNVNAFRFILSRYLGYDLPPLPDCHLSMGNKFNLFSFTLLNEKLTSEDARQQCAPYLGKG